jgi:hypothetical protein
LSSTGPFEAILRKASELTYASIGLNIESLGSMPEAIGHKLIVQIDARDMRTVRGHLESGEDVGILTASKAW